MLANVVDAGTTLPKTIICGKRFFSETLRSMRSSVWSQVSYRCPRKRTPVYAYVLFDCAFRQRIDKSGASDVRVLLTQFSDLNRYRQSSFSRHLIVTGPHKYIHSPVLIRFIFTHSMAKINTYIYVVAVAMINSMANEYALLAYSQKFIGTASCYAKYWPLTALITNSNWHVDAQQYEITFIFIFRFRSPCALPFAYTKR